jgi:hypothetical protein
VRGWLDGGIDASIKIITAIEIQNSFINFLQVLLHIFRF